MINKSTSQQAGQYGQIPLITGQILQFCNITGDTFASASDTIEVIRNIKTLRKPYADVLTLSYNAGYTQVEIGGILRLPLGTVESWFRIGIKNLRMQYERLSQYFNNNLILFNSILDIARLLKAVKPIEPPH